LTVAGRCRFGGAPVGEVRGTDGIPGASAVCLWRDKVDGVCRTSRCENKCGGTLKVCQVNHYLAVYDLLPDGQIDESSKNVVKCFDDDSTLELVCDRCHRRQYGLRDASGALFQEG